MCEVPQERNRLFYSLLSENVLHIHPRPKNGISEINFQFENSLPDGANWVGLSLHREAPLCFGVVFDPAIGTNGGLQS